MASSMPDVERLELRSAQETGYVALDGPRNAESRSLNKGSFGIWTSILGGERRCGETKVGFNKSPTSI